MLTLARVILHRLSFLDKDAASIFIESTFCISAASSRSEVCKLTQVGFKTAEFAVLFIHHVHLSPLESRVVYWQISSFTFGTQDVTSLNVRGVSIAEIRTQFCFFLCVFFICNYCTNFVRFSWSYAQICFLPWWSLSRGGGLDYTRLCLNAVSTVQRLCEWATCNIANPPALFRTTTNK